MSEIPSANPMISDHWSARSIRQKRALSPSQPTYLRASSDAPIAVHRLLLTEQQRK